MSPLPLLLALGCLAFAAPFARGADPLADASQFAAKAEWEKAQSAYAEALKENPERSGAFFYNYGTAALQNNQSGTASTLLLKALRLNPFDGDARANLRLARGKMGPAALATRPASALSWWPEDARAFPVPLWWIFGLILLAPFLLVSARAQPPSYRWPLFAGALFFLLGGACATFDQRFPQGGLLTPAKVLSGPAPSFPEIGTLDSGSLVSLEEERNGWFKIRYVNATGQVLVGWAEAASLLSLKK